jgi:mRNA interferase MazF
MDWTIKRGDVYFIEREDSEVGSEQRAGRPAIVVSNDAQNATSNVVQVVFLTTRPKTDLPTHVTVRSTGVMSTALCEQVTPVDISRIGDWRCTCSNTEMEAINRALSISLALESKAPAPVEKTSGTGDAKFWKDMYDSLLDRMLGKG